MARRGKRVSPREILCGLDIGTTKAACVIGRAPLDGGALQLLGQGVVPNRGVRQGQVVDLEALVEAIEAALQAAEQSAGRRVHQAFVSVSAPQVRSLRAKGAVSILAGGGEIRRKDVERVRLQAQTLSLSLDQELLHTVPIAYAVDDQDGISEPIGLFGAKLAVHLHLVVAPAALLQNYGKACHLAGLDVEDFVAAGWATALAVLQPEERSRGALAMDIGGTTSDAVYVQGDRLLHALTLSVGGEGLTEALALRWRVPRERADVLKRELLTAGSAQAQAVTDVSRELLQSIRQGLVEAWQPEAMPRTGVVLAGRTSLLDGLVEQTEDVFEAPARLGMPYLAAGRATEETFLYTTAVGLLEYGRLARTTPIDGRPEPRSLPGRLLAKARDLYEEYF